MRRLTIILLIFCAVTDVTAQKIGLVLGGGGAKGGAEVGVLKVLDSLGVHPDYIVGTSIGSVVGSLYAAGYSGKDLERLFCNQEWLTLLTDRRPDLSGEPFKQAGGVTYIFGFPVLDTTDSRFGLLSGARVEQMVDSMLSARGCTTFRSLPIPFRCIAADMSEAEEVVLQRGNVARAVRASIAIPGIFKPVTISGRQLIDGGMMNNLPVDVAREMGADIVIAVDLQQSSDTPREERDNLITVVGDLIGVGPIARWIVNRPDITKYARNRELADVYIQPLLPDYDATSFGNNNMQAMIAIGEQATRNMVPKILNSVLKSFITNNLKH